MTVNIRELEERIISVTQLELLKSLYLEHNHSAPVVVVLNPAWLQGQDLRVIAGLEVVTLERLELSEIYVGDDDLVRMLRAGRV